jgi:geranylgeranyl diphosphate synthase type I
MTTVKKVVTDTKSKKSRKAKEDLIKFVSVIDKKLEKYFDNEIKNVYGVSTEEKEFTKTILRHIKEHNLRPAKRLRASFAYHAYKMLGGKKEKVALDAGVSVELVHTALLMHDDFMDQDDTRRGKPTTHKYFESYHRGNNYRFDPNHFGNAMAVNSGDVALCLGYESLSNTDTDPEKKTKALSRFIRGIINTACGQNFDINLEAKGKAKEKDIINLHHAKTAIYTYENPLHIGAILAGAEKSDLEVLTGYAIPGGIAFQLQDDILGLFGDPQKTGKPAHSDLRQGKMTLLIIKALEKAKDKQKKLLNKYWGNRNVTDIEAEVVRKIVKDTGSFDYSVKVSRDWARKAQKAIPEMKKKGWDKNAINYLDGIAEYMVERDV